MYRSIRIALSAGAILLASAAVPPMLPGSTTISLSGSALAQKTPTTNSINLNSSKSNVNRNGVPGKGQQPPGPAKATTVRGSKSNSSERTTQSGEGQQPPGPAAATTIKSSKSNGSFRTTQPGKGQQPPGPAEATTVSSSKSNTSD